MIFCACDNLGRQDIAFPYPSEIKVNGHEVKANLHGLNNKPGSTSPVDITEDLRFNISYVNNVEIAYALTNKVDSGFLYVSWPVTLLPISLYISPIAEPLGTIVRSISC